MPLLWHAEGAFRRRPHASEVCGGGGEPAALATSVEMAGHAALLPPMLVLFPGPSVASPDTTASYA
eukprot:scaffold171_cov263-Pinguiococcus_pyrenoidosus.AAC.3